MDLTQSTGHNVLLLWPYYVSEKHLIEVVENLQNAVGDKKVVAVDNLEEQLIVSDHASSSFDVVYCGTLTPTLVFHPDEVFAEIARILKPGGTVIIRESVSTNDNVPALRTSTKLASALKLSGFVNVSQPKTLSISKDNVKEYEEHFQRQLQNISLIEIRANKPSFEVGSAISLSSSKTSSRKTDPTAAKIRMLSTDDTLDENVELINEDDLLNENDLIKPDPSTLKEIKEAEVRNVSTQTDVEKDNKILKLEAECASLKEKLAELEKKYTAVAKSFESNATAKAEGSDFESTSVLRHRVREENEKPGFTLFQLILQAFISSSSKKMHLSDIYSYICGKYPFFSVDDSKWKKSIRAEICRQSCFERKAEAAGKGSYYQLISDSTDEELMENAFLIKKLSAPLEKSLPLSTIKLTMQCSDDPVHEGGPISVTGIQAQALDEKDPSDQLQTYEKLRENSHSKIRE